VPPSGLLCIDVLTSSAGKTKPLHMRSCLRRGSNNIRDAPSPLLTHALPALARGVDMVVSCPSLFFPNQQRIPT